MIVKNDRHVCVSLHLSISARSRPPFSSRSQRQRRTGPPQWQTRARRGLSLPPALGPPRPPLCPLRLAPPRVAGTRETSRPLHGQRRRRRPHQREKRLSASSHNTRRRRPRPRTFAGETLLRCRPDPLPPPLREHRGLHALREGQCAAGDTRHISGGAEQGPPGHIRGSSRVAGAATGASHSACAPPAPPRGAS